MSPDPDDPDGPADDSPGEEATEEAGDVRSTNPLDRLFRRKNPFEGVFAHTQKIRECVELLEDGIEAYVANDWEEFHELTQKVNEVEHEADGIQANIRSHLPRFIFMPVNKGDLEHLLHLQDSILDQAENLMEMMDARHTRVPDPLMGEFRTHVRLAIETVKAYEAAVDEFHDVLDSGFGGGQRDEAKRAIKVVHEMEYEADQLRYDLVRQIYEHEDELEPMDVYHLLKIADWVDNIADQAENSADKLRAMMAK